MALALGCSGKPVSAWEWKDPSYVRFEFEEVKKWIPKPPQKNSKEWNKQLALVLDYQKKRTQKDCELAVSEGSTVKFEVFYGAPNGPLSGGEVEKLKDFMNAIRWDVDHPVHHLKKHYMTERPFAESEKVTLCPGIKAEKTKSYPSGHSAISRIFALALSEWDPSRADIFLKRADEVALGRVYGGVHYPNDTEMGKKVAAKVWEALKQNKEFLDDFEKLKN